MGGTRDVRAPSWHVQSSAGAYVAMPNDDVIIVACPSCSQKYRVPEAQIGQKAVCKKCGQSFRIAIDSPIDEDTLFGWVMEDSDGSSESVMGSSSIFGTTPVEPPRPRRAAVPSTPRIHLADLDEQGAHFSFPASLLADVGLRESFPLYCVHCMRRENLNVQLVVWADVLSPEQREAAVHAERQTVRPLAHLRREHGAAWMDTIVPATSFPAPFDRPFAYFVCGDCLSAPLLACRVVRERSIVTCRVVVANLGLAVDFFRNNGGRDTPSYRRLLMAGRQQRDRQWTALPVSVRARVSTWFALHEGEQFLGYFADRTGGRPVTGDEGLVLTDRRMVCRSGRVLRELFLVRGGVLEVQADPKWAVVTVRQGREVAASLTVAPLYAGSMAKSLQSLGHPWTIRARVEPQS